MAYSNVKKKLLYIKKRILDLTKMNDTVILEDSSLKNFFVLIIVFKNVSILRCLLCRNIL